MLKRALLGASALVLLSGVASAADLGTRYPTKAPVMAAPVFSWTGLYLGAQIGYSWASVNTQEAPGGLAYGMDGDGFVAGGFVGYNYQFANNVVVGLETDLNWSNVGASSTFGGVSFGENWFGTVRGRIGYAFDRILVYGAGGFAYSNTDFTYWPLSQSHSNTGWTLGAGVDYAFTNNVIGRVEYRYTDYGSQDYNVAPTVSVGYSDNKVLTGLGYKF